ncbi:hypothetical protein [Brassicibacter mesophilus]|uniref:hypothetical protein n=1 Tax=Brassicibacter mesophilus TaxID=745119 RepID=UPI003D2129CA
METKKENFILFKKGNDILDLTQVRKENTKYFYIIPEMNFPTSKKIAKDNIDNYRIVDLTGKQELSYYIDLLYGDVETVIKRLEEIFISYQSLGLESERSAFYQSLNLDLLRKAIVVVKKLRGDSASLTDLFALLIRKDSRKMINDFSRLPANQSEVIELDYIKDYLLNDYFMDKSKTFYNTTSLRLFINYLVQTIKANGKRYTLFDKLFDVDVFTFPLNIREETRFLYLNIVEEIISEYLTTFDYDKVEIISIENSDYSFSRLNKISSFLNMNSRYFRDYYKKEDKEVFIDFSNTENRIIGFPII